jgi:hypothetical protein
MEVLVPIITIIGLLAIGIFAYIFLGLLLKICLLWIPIALGFFLPVFLGFVMGPSIGGVGILLGIFAAYYVYDKWEDHTLYMEYTKKIDRVFYTE